MARSLERECRITSHQLAKTVDFRLVLHELREAIRILRFPIYVEQRNSFIRPRRLQAEIMLDQLSHIQASEFLSVLAQTRYQPE